MNTIYLYALASNFCFALGSQVYTHFSRSVSSVWMNSIKALVALLAFGLTILLTDGFSLLNWQSYGLLFLSGALGLGLGDWLLLTSFREMGPGRTMILFGFQPVIVGTLGFLFLGQLINAQKFWGILFFILCLMTISYESFQAHRSFQLKGIGFSFLGMCLDGFGIIMSRIVFDAHPELSVFEGNFYRCLGALTFFFLFSRFRPIHFLGHWKQQTSRAQMILIIGSLIGTFVSLSLYLKALQSAHLASLAGIAITGTVFSSLFECILQKKWPSPYLILAFLFFLFGMRFILF